MTTAKRTTRKRRKSLSALIDEAYKLSDKLRVEVGEASVVQARRQPDKVRAAIHEVLAMLYFGEQHKWEGKLQSVLAHLSPELAKLAEERGYDVAYTAFNGEVD
jgi:hypothetical protein